MVWNFVVQIVASLVLTAISYALSPKPKIDAPKAAGLDDFDLPTAEEGRPIPVVFGTVLLRGPERRLGRGSQGRSDPQEGRQEMSEDLIVTVQDLRASRLCFQGARPWFRRHGLDWQAFLADGLPCRRAGRDRRCAGTPGDRRG